MTSLKDILAMPRYADLMLLTDEDRLNDHVIQSVEVSETPDMEFYIPEGVFLLTTAMYYRDKQEALIPLIDSLIRAKAVGIGIKTNRFLETLDQKVIDYANSVNFPIVHIPDNYSLGSLLHRMLNMLWGKKYEEITFALDIQQRFSHLLLQDVSSDVLIRELSLMVKTPVILLNPFKEIIAQSNHFNDSTNKASFYVKEMFQSIKQKNDLQHYQLITNPSGQTIQVSLTEIFVHNYYPYYLLILNPEHIPYPISNFAIEQAVLVLSHQFLKNEKVIENRIMLESDYFKEWINVQNYNNLREAVKNDLNLNYGFKDSQEYRIIHVSEHGNLKHRKRPNTRSHEKQTLIANWLDSHLKDYLPQAKLIHFSISNETFILLQSKPVALSEILQQIHNALNHALSFQLIFSLGDSVNLWSNIHESLKQARLVYSEREIDAETVEIEKYFESKGIIHLFSDLDGQDIQYFCKNVLKDFAYPEEKSLIELRKTLKTYLNAQCEIAATANKLYIHRNTVKYRIERCEEILGISITEPENSLNLRLALKLSENHLNL